MVSKIRRLPNLIPSLIFAFYVSYAGAQTACSAGTTPCTSSLSATLRKIFEIPPGLTDGKNRTFHLTYTPAPGTPVHLFRNGLEMASGVDFTLSGSVITITGRVVEHSGDVFQADYSFVAESPARSALASSEVQTSGQASEVLSRYLQRSLDRELSEVPVQRRIDTPQSKPAFNVSSGPSEIAEQLRQPRSLVMLSAALERGRDVKAANQRISGRRSQSSVADGIDGLGDGTDANPFEAMTNSPAGLSGILDQIDGKDRGGSVRTNLQRKVQAGSRALKMLKQKLQETY